MRTAKGRIRTKPVASVRVPQTFIMSFRVFVQEEVDNEYEEETSQAEETMDQTGNEDEDENLISTQTHQVRPFTF